MLGALENTGIREQEGKAGIKLHNFGTRAFPQSDPHGRVQGAGEAPRQIQFPRGGGSSLTEERHLAAESPHTWTLPRPSAPSLRRPDGAALSPPPASRSGHASSRTGPGASPAESPPFLPPGLDASPAESRLQAPPGPPRLVL